MFSAGEQGVETGCGLAGLHVAGSLFVGVEAVDRDAFGLLAGNGHVDVSAIEGEVALYFDATAF